MFLNHLKFAIRVFLKDKFFSILNILGLALGIAVSIILLLILQHDLSYDQHYAKGNRIYRLGAHLQATGLDVKVARSARELGQILKDELPEVEQVVRANNWDHTMVKYQSKGGLEKAFYEEDIIRTDSTFFQVFDHPFVSGNPATCLTGQNAVVISEAVAKKYFGDEDPLDKTLVIGNESWKVTAVIRNVPENTHLKFDFVLSRLVDREWVMDKGTVKSEAFWNPDVYTYLLLPDQYDVGAFESKFAAIYNKHFKSFGDQVGGHYTPILEPLTSIHFHSDLQGDEPHGNMAYVYAFSGIGIFIILLACINYMNLATAKSLGRATEIAMKKTLGSGRGALVMSFLGESVFLSFISLLLAISLVFVVLRATSFNELISKNLSPDFLHNPVLLSGSIGITLLIGIVSGLYPAFYLPGIPTIQALKGAFKNRKSGHVLRRALITVQFAISIFVVVCILLMRNQINFVRSTELGFDKENVLVLPIEDTLVQKQIHAVKQEFLQNPHIVSAATSYHVPGMNTEGNLVMMAEGEAGMRQQAFTLMVVGEDFMKSMGMKLTSGREFQSGSKVDIEKVFIVNEAGAKVMGWGTEAVGKKIKYFHDKEDGKIIGVVKNFNFKSLHNAVEPLLIVKAGDEGGFLYLKINGNLPETMDFIRKKWMQWDPGHPYEYFFLDQRFNEQYKADEVQYKLLSGLSYICIFISLLGLLGLSAFAATQRTKEIGIRKVHGASVPRIIFLLYKDVMILVLLASILVVPVAYYVMQGWLSNFAFQTEVSYLVFVAVACGALIFSFLTVAFHSWKTARTNPVVSLKYE